MTQTIALIEDDADIRELTDMMLGAAGYTVLTAASGEEGMALLAEQPADLLILDIMLPGINGWEVCRRLREDPRTAALPILIFTVRSERLDAHRTEWTLANAVLSKPFLREELLHRVAVLLDAGKVPATT